MSFRSLLRFFDDAGHANMRAVLFAMSAAASSESTNACSTSGDDTNSISVIFPTPLLRRERVHLPRRRPVVILGSR